MVIYHIQLQTLPSLPSSLEGVAGAKYAVYSAENPSCPAKVDLGIILDNSGSVDDEYETVKSAAKAIMRNFNVSMDNTRVGLVEFDEGAYIHLHLTESISNDHVETLFDQRYNPIGSGTWISGGLDLMRTSVFNESSGMRSAVEGIPRVVFLISDGEQTIKGNDDTAIAAAEALRRERNVTLYAIGVGSAEKSTMRAIAGSTDRYFVGEWHDLIYFALRALQGVCNSIVPPPCPANTYGDASPSPANGNRNCTACPETLTSVPGSAKCTLCRAGFTGPEGGPCAPCPAGTYKDRFWSASCIDCPEGYTSIEGSTACPLCSAGFTGPDCVPCPKGTYKNALGSADCTDCESGEETITTRC